MVDEFEKNGQYTIEIPFLTSTKMMNNNKYKQLVRKLLSSDTTDRDVIECRSKILEKIRRIKEKRKRKTEFVRKIETLKTRKNMKTLLEAFEKKRRRKPRNIPPLKKIPKKGPYAHLGPDTRRKLLPVLKKKGLLKLKPRNGPYGVPFTKTSIDSTQFSSLINNGISSDQIRSSSMDDWEWRPPSAELQEEGFPLKFSRMTKFYEACGTDPWISQMRK